MMAFFDSNAREALVVAIEDAVSSSREQVAIGRQDIRAAIDAVDQWIDDNQASFNAALPEAARTNLTAAQKARLLFYVVRKRYEVT